MIKSGQLPGIGNHGFSRGQIKLGEKLVPRDIAKRLKQEIAIWRVGAIPGLAIIGFVILARLTGTLQSLEWQTLDAFLRLRPEEPVDERIVIVGINEDDIKKAGTYPIPDREMASLLKTLLRYKPRAIGLDIYRDLPVEQGHGELVAAFKESKNLIAIEKVTPMQVAPPPVLPSEQVGFADVILDDDGHLRRSFLRTLTYKEPKVLQLSLSLRLAKAYLLARNIPLEQGIQDPYTLRFNRTELPRFTPNAGGYVRADAGGLQVLLNPRSGRERFRVLSLNDIKAGNFNPSWIEDRIVLIGITAPSVKDIINSSTITSSNLGYGLVYGVEFQAHAVSQIISAVLDGRPLLRGWSPGWQYVWILCWGSLGIAIGRFTQSPLRNLLGAGVATISLTGFSYILLTWGWWIPVVPTILGFSLNSIVLTAVYQHDRTLKWQISDRQFIIEHTFDTIHNGPLQTLAKLLRDLREQESPQNRLIEELEHLNYELRAVYESVRREALTSNASLHLGSNQELNLQNPLHEVLYQVYSNTLERDFPCFKTLKVKVYNFDSIDNRYLNIEQKRGLCRFLEEALCNVGKHALGVTRLTAIYTQKEGWYILSIADNGQGSLNSNSEGRGTQQCRELAKQLKGKFERSPLSPKGTLCELRWPVAKSWVKQLLVRG